MKPQDIPLVVTTINPFGRLERELRCFNAWRALGFEILTANVSREARLLRQAGVPASAFLILDDSDTALHTRGKPVPKVMAVIEKARKRAGGRSIILTNADILPAVNSEEFACYFLAQAPILALTREDASLIENHSAAARNSYRGGLDVFMFRADTRADFLAQAALFPVSAEMAFGIPGWDYLMGALVLASGGAIMDSRVLLHERHPSTYSAIGTDLEPYVPALQALGAARSLDPSTAAAEFAALVDRHARENEAVSDLAHQLYYRVPACPPASEKALAICADILALAPFLRWRTDVAAMAALAEAHLQSKDNGYDRSVSFFVDSQAVRQGFAEHLVALLFHLKCRRDTRDPVTTDYPPNNVHAAALAMAQHPEDPFAERLAVLRLFADELALISIFNPRLYDYLALSCDNDEERGLVKALADEIDVPGALSQDAGADVAAPSVSLGQSHAA